MWVGTGLCCLSSGKRTHVSCTTRAWDMPGILPESDGAFICLFVVVLCWHSSLSRASRLKGICSSRPASLFCSMTKGAWVPCGRAYRGTALPAGCSWKTNWQESYCEARLYTGSQSSIFCHASFLLLCQATVSASPKCFCCIQQFKPLILESNIASEDPGE